MRFLRRQPEALDLGIDADVELPFEGHRGLDSLDTLSHDEVRQLVIALLDKAGGVVTLDRGRLPDLNRRVEIELRDTHPGVAFVRVEER